MIWYFSIFVFYFLIEKLLACVPHVSASGWRPCQSGGTCDTTPLPNLAICSLLRCAIVFFFTWYDVCKLMVVGLLPLIDCFCLFFLFSPFTARVHNYLICLLFFNFSPYFLNFLFHRCLFYRLLFCFFLILPFNRNFSCVFFHFSPHSFNFLFYFYSFYSFSSPKFVIVFG